jgi:hypothetical protein
MAWQQTRKLKITPFKTGNLESLKTKTASGVYLRLFYDTQIYKILLILNGTSVRSGVIFFYDFTS